MIKTVHTYKTDAKPENFWRHGLMACLSIGVGTLIYALLTNMKTEAILERIFFQSFAILTFCFIMNNSYKIYRKGEKVEHEIEIKQEEKEANFTF